MKHDGTCWGPFTVETDLSGSGTSFIDSSEPRRVAIVTSCEAPVESPCGDAVLLHEEVNCPESNCDIRWYECPSQLGRTYTLEITACEVVITSFENGFLSINNCDVTSFGTKSFCFGKAYGVGGETVDINDCVVSFEFEGHSFTITGNYSDEVGIFDCVACWGEVTTFGGGEPIDPTQGGGQQLPDPPSQSGPGDPTTGGGSADPENLNPGTPIDSELRTEWFNRPESDPSVGLDVFCNDGVGIPRSDQCQSQDNPAIAILQSGQSIIAYEDRDVDGKTKITLQIFRTSVKDSIPYYKSLSRGRLINNPALPTAGVFEVFDDVLIDSDENSLPDTTTLIGFITGPLRGGTVFHVDGIVRSVSGGRVKHTITFLKSSNEFADSNHASDVEWFLIKDVDDLPTTSIDLPRHAFNAIQTPVSNPSIAVDKNNLGLAGDQNVYVTYQAFENGQWNVYIRHLILSDRSASSPTYLTPYIFGLPQLVSTPVIGDFTELDYEIVGLEFGIPGQACALMQATTTTGFPVITGLTGSGQTTSCGQTIDLSRAYIEVTFNTNSCGTTIPSAWLFGAVFTGGIPPSAGEIGWAGDPSCITIDAYPSSLSDWKFEQPSCNQTDLIDDPYCPSPYLSMTYKPAELYTLTVGDDTVTRVLYHVATDIAGIGAANGEPIDFMFVVDHSGSMGNDIAAVAVAIPDFAQTLQGSGVDVRFGLTVYGRGPGQSGPNGSLPVNPIICGNLGGEMFDGLNYSGSTAEGGFTSNVNDLTIAINPITGWGIPGSAAPGYSAVRFANKDSRFVWREGIKRFVFLITDTTCFEWISGCTAAYSNDESLAIQDSLDNNCTVILAIEQDPLEPLNGLCYENLSEQTGWTAGSYPVAGTPDPAGNPSYSAAFDGITSELVTSFIRTVTVVERDEQGYEPTFLRNAELLVTYQGNLLDIWTQSKNNLVFVEGTPTGDGATKGLIDFPFPIYQPKVFDVDPVHINGDISNWVFFGGAGSISLNFPNVGVPSGGWNEPIKIADNATRAKIATNNRGDVFVAYEMYEAGFPQIEIVGTGDFAQDSITGAKSSRVTRFITEEDFDFKHSLSLSTEGVNQLCDLVVDKNDVTHVAWQSNRDNQWEIYYANAKDIFEPVRVTDSESRSGFPRIEVDDNGTIFIVYHDNRFGPYDIMLSYKDESRTLPLLQQDPYLASLAEGYTHYTNILPVTLTNFSTSTVSVPGMLFGSKTSTDPGNGEENYIFGISDPGPGGRLSGGGDSEPYKVAAMAGSLEGNMYGVTEPSDAYGIITVLQIDIPEPEEPYLDIETNEITEIGDIDLGAVTILDAAFDVNGRLWILFSDDDDGAIQITNVDVNDNANILTTTVLFSSSDQVRGGLEVKSDGTFWFVAYQGGQTQIFTSVYPLISGGVAIFNFKLLTSSPGINPQSLTVDENDTIFALDGFSVSTIQDSGEVTLQYIIIPSGFPTPLSLISGFAYHVSGVTTATGTSGFYNVFLQFYDNLNLEGEPRVEIDSRLTLDAFLNIAEVDDPYFVNANGVFLEPGQSRVVFFDASLARPNSTQLAYPFGFDRNQTFFPKVSSIAPDGSITVQSTNQRVSFSCHRCNRGTSSSPDFHTCSYAFVVRNGADPQFFNFKVDFYADKGRQKLIRRFELSPGHPDLQFAEVDNRPAPGQWSGTGLEFGSGDAKFIEVHPGIEPDTGFVCGIRYATKIMSCENDGLATCTDFTTFDLNRWFKIHLPDNPQGPSSHKQVDITQIDDKIGYTYEGNNGFTLFYGTVDIDKFLSGEDDIFSNLVDIASVAGSGPGGNRAGRDPSLRQIDGRAGIAHGNSTLGILYSSRASDGRWSTHPVHPSGAHNVQGSQLLREFNGKPAIFASTFGSHVIYAEANDVNGETWDITTLGTTITTFGSAGGLSHSVIDGIPYVNWLNLSGTRTFAQRISAGVWDITTPTAPNEWIPFPHDILDIEGKLFTIGILNGTNTVVWATFSKAGPTDAPEQWVVGGTIFGLTADLVSDRGNLTLINGKPSWSYMYITGVTSEIRITQLISNTLAENIWETTVVDTGFSVHFLQGGRLLIGNVSISQILNFGVIFKANFPTSIYINRPTDLSTVTANNDEFFCECASNIFEDAIQPLPDIGRWQSSAHGVSDTRVTDSLKDSQRPGIATRSTEGAIILFEDYNENLKGKVLGATFHKSNVDETFGSGTKSWFDYDLNISGRDVDVTVDLFDRSAATYEVPDAIAGKQDKPTEVPGNAVFFKNCDFEQPARGVPGTQEGCNIDSLETNIISKDDFISSAIVKKIVVDPEFVEYHTYNASQLLTPVVKVCDIRLQIWATPEVVAIRIKNENVGTFGKWCPTSPELSDYLFEKEWSLSKNAGIKEVCVQAMTYSGITTQFCLPVIADYPQTIFELNLYSDDSYTIPLPLHDGLFVASTKFDTSLLSAKETETVFVEIVPNITISETSINYDVIQQGSNDLLNRGATTATDTLGRTVFRGSFLINREDKVFNIDGLTRIRVKIPGTCDEDTFVSAESTFDKEQFNRLSKESEPSIREDAGDVLSDFRQQISGRVGVDIVLRPTDDPYLIFGDPDMFLNKKLPTQQGVKQEPGDDERAGGGTGGVSDPGGGGGGGGGGTPGGGGI